MGLRQLSIVDTWLLSARDRRFSGERLEQGSTEKSRTGPLYHLSHGQRGPGGLELAANNLFTPPTQMAGQKEWARSDRQKWRTHASVAE
jgi:hypothetical protein